MNDVFILKAAHHMDDGVHLAVVGQELVSEALAFACALHEAGDVDKLNPSGEDVDGTGNLGEHLHAVVRHGHQTRVRFNRAEREVGGLGLSVSDYGIK